jgi:AcrR family transcriptional regulator
MKTRERIIIKAIELLNEKGIPNVRMREIADALGMSVGNVTYYFPRWNDLMEELNHQMMLEISHLPRIPFNLSDLHSVFERVPIVQEKYGFITRDIHLFISQYPEFARLRKTLVGSRIQDMITQLSIWSEEDICHADSTDHNHKRIAVKMWLLLASWSVQDNLLKETEYALSKEEFLAIIWQIFTPHFTAKGLAAFREIREKARF